MHYFIDGYNMLFRLLHSSENLQSQREAFIVDLNKKISFLKLDVSIVFDSTFQIGGRERSHYDALEILYSAEGETADEYILDELKNALHPQQETVVTSDKKLAWRARNRSAQTQRVDEFIQWLNRTYKKKLRQLKKNESLPPSPNTTAPHPISKHRPSIPSKDAPLEAYADYYAQIFESELKEMDKEQEISKQIPSPKISSSRKRTPRKPKQHRDPFQPPPTVEENEATEMERWLKTFEKRLSDPDVDLFSKH
jgi:predicted RNA-binding protein with PIN domain